MPAKKGKKRAKLEGEERLSGGGNAKKQKQREKLEVARGVQKLAALRAEIVADKDELDAKLAELEARGKEINKREAKIAAKAARVERKKAQRVATAAAREEAKMSRFLSSFTGAEAPSAKQRLVEDEEKLKHTKGMITTESQSRCILLLVIDRMKKGASSSEANTQVAQALRVGEKKVKAIRKAWRTKNVFLSSSGKGRGTVKGQEDKRLLLTAVQKAELGDFIGKEHERGRQVFCRTVKEWLKNECMIDVSTRSVGRLLFRLNYRRRRGRIKVPPFNDERLARIRRFLVEIDRAVKEENEGDAVLVYMDESFVHQAHGSAYSYFFMDQEGVVDDGFGRTSGKGLRMIMVHAITKHGPLVTRCDDESSDDSTDARGFPIEEGWFKAKEKGRGIQGKENFTHADVETAEFLWQAKLAKGDYHAAMTDEMFMTWLEKRLAPAFRKVFGDRKMILILDNAPYLLLYAQNLLVEKKRYR